MLKECDANCEAKVPHLWLRNNIFIIESSLNVWMESADISAYRYTQTIFSKQERNYAQ